MARSDPQQSKAYAWENSFTKHNRLLSQREMWKLVKQACRLYRVPMVHMRFPNKNTYAGKTLPSQYDPNEHSITVRPRHMTIDVALHESAHAICDWVLGWQHAAHGPRWVSIYMVLLDRFKVMPVVGAKAMARKHGLKWAPLYKVAPKNIRRLHPRLVKLARFNHPEELVEWLAGK